MLSLIVGVILLVELFSTLIKIGTISNIDNSQIGLNNLEFPTEYKRIIHPKSSHFDLKIAVGIRNETLPRYNC